jgi:hypothetical protein
MLRTALRFAMLAALAFAARAGEDVAPAVKSYAPSLPAPQPAFAAPPTFELPGGPAPGRQGAFDRALAPPKGRCRIALCYQAGDGALSIGGAREFMPQVDGLRAEGISVRSRRVTFRYSF